MLDRKVKPAAKNELIAKLERKFRPDSYILVSAGSILTRGIEKGRWLPGLYAKKSDKKKEPILNLERSCALDIIHGYVQPDKKIILKKYWGILKI